MGATCEPNALASGLINLARPDASAFGSPSGSRLTLIRHRLLQSRSIMRVVKLDLKLLDQLLI